MNNASKIREQYRTTGELKSGTTANNKSYNMVIYITGPNSYIDGQVSSFIDYNTNIHHEFVGTKIQHLDDSISRACIYIYADPYSLWYLKLKKDGNVKV